MIQCILLVTLLLSLFGIPSLAAQVPDVAGRWLLTMPRGFEYDATLEPAGEAGLFRLRCKALNLQGLYELRGRRLTMVKPNQERMQGLVWEVKNKNVLLLIEHPKQSQAGSDYRNATLSRSVRQTQPKISTDGAPAPPTRSFLFKIRCEIDFEFFHR